MVAVCTTPPPCRHCCIIVSVHIFSFPSDCSFLLSRFSISASMCVTYRPCSQYVTLLYRHILTLRECFDKNELWEQLRCWYWWRASLWLWFPLTYCFCNCHLDSDLHLVVPLKPLVEHISPMLLLMGDPGYLLRTFAVFWFLIRDLYVYF